MKHLHLILCALLLAGCGENSGEHVEAQLMFSSSSQYDIWLCPKGTKPVGETCLLNPYAVVLKRKAIQ